MDKEDSEDFEIGGGAARLLVGDSLVRLKGIPDNSVDAIVGDPPYGLTNNSGGPSAAGRDSPAGRAQAGATSGGFMGMKWDADVPSVEIWAECLRILKPGGYLLAFSGSRTYHRMACRVEDAGFEIRDMIAWAHAQGFPKSRNIAELDLEGEDARLWAGWGTALKPAIEPIVVARKPLIGTVASNILAHGTGALNIDACRVEAVDETDAQGYSAKCASVVGLASNINGNAYGEFAGARQDSAHELGRFPANLIHDGSPEVVALFPDSKGSGGSVPNVKITGYGGGAVGTGESKYLGGERTKVDCGSGSAARFFKQVGQPDDDDLAAAALVYCAKASRAERDRGLEGFELRAPLHGKTNIAGGLSCSDSKRLRANTHPTVKPVELMRYLCRLVTPQGGTVLDPFMGSGTTGCAAMLEGFRFIGCELMPEYAQIARARISHAWEAAQPTPEIDDDQQLDLFPVELRKCSAM